MPNPNYTLNYQDFINQVNPLLKGGNSWQQKDGDPYGLALKLADGRTWNPSGASSGVKYTPKGSRVSGGEWRDSGESGGYMTPEVLADNDMYEVSGDMSALNGAPGSRQHTNVRYERQGDQLVPVNQTDWQWASEYDSLRKAAAAAAAIYGVGTGLEAFSGAGGGTGAAPGLLSEGASPLAFNAAADSQLANVAIAAEGGNALAGYAMPTSAASAAGGGSGLLNSVTSGLKTLAPSGLLSGASSLSDLAKLALPIAAAVAGSKPTTTESSNQNRLDPRMDQYIYGPDGVLPAAQDWYKANKTGLNDQMRQGLATQTAVLNDPDTMAGYKRAQNLGMGLMNAPVAGNPFSDGRASLNAPVPPFYR